MNNWLNVHNMINSHDRMADFSFLFRAVKNYEIMLEYNSNAKEALLVCMVVVEHGVVKPRKLSACTK